MGAQLTLITDGTTAEMTVNRRSRYYLNDFKLKVSLLPKNDCKQKVSYWSIFHQETQVDFLWLLERRPNRLLERRSKRLLERRPNRLLERQPK